VPLQHGDDAMLARMKRGGSAGSYLRLLERLRAAMPEIAVRTTFLVGFPGESDESFASLVRFVREARFDRVGVFTYSPEEGTPGFSMEEAVPKKLARERRAALMEAQQPLSLEKNRELLGREITVLRESERAGRTWRDAPEIDGLVRLEGATGEPGTFVRARVREALPYDVIAEAI
jgi:ribosomal protein S12 methylthiotransferase